MSQLPIQAVMPELLAAVAQHSQLILKAAPGAGKSTYFPLQLLLNRAVTGKIIMLEPRRLAARNIASYLAKQLGEAVGQRVGYRVRGESKVSAATQLEIVTEGVMTRMIQSDPELSGVDMLIFDEFHERSIHADTALALALEVQEALRDDLKLVVMSATLDHDALQNLLPDAPFIQSQGRAFEVEIRYQPLGANDYLPLAMSKTIEQLLAQQSGSVLAFLPGVSAIQQVAERLAHLSEQVQICPLYGQLPFDEQQKAIQAPKPGERKVVLATNIAETSLTIEGIRLVVDSGLERVARFDVKTGLTSLEQVRIAQSSAIQRAGRAGRIEEGICVRLYSSSQFQQMPAVPVAEIMQSDLSALMMELAQWGVSEPNALKLLDIPPAASIAQAKNLLTQLGLVKGHQLTAQGALAQKLGLAPRLAAMLIACAKQSHALLQSAIAAAVLLEDPEKNGTHLGHSLHRWQSGKHAKKGQLSKRAATLASKLSATFALSDVEEPLLAVAMSFAYPDRVAQRRNKQNGRYILANGHGGELREDDPLGDNDYLVAAELLRSGGNASQIQLAAPLCLPLLEQYHPALLQASEQVDWDENKGRLVAEKQTRIGELIVAREPLPQPGKEKMTQALLSYVRRKGLNSLDWTPKAQALLQRIRCAIEWLPEQTWPAMDDASLLNDLPSWLAPYMNHLTSVKDLSRIALCEALNARLGWPLNQQLDVWLPQEYVLPTGTRQAIRYQEGASPVLSVRMQELFGESTSPTIAQGRIKLTLELLSPARRPLQVTQDLAGFWAGAYKEVQKEMKGRYPKHVWPDDPANHIATTKTKRQLNS
ncbi:ATP-dependent helicase HrpB [Vibrio navarrensis]|uniref:ATP-dependent helicase HrpB n=1 Tax=Vibrio navarrensis TaxID=29495 RepID=UPI001869B0D9|nr:ATP-dependent helicase HrpB [Vibrio navarrensis]MBE4576107.1 ATP-dependent helicase HrpB [Vibrio navarrensis]MBE4595192.1 ATP-dependent helicase HrpB [Vibrio navarrensis]